MKESSINPMPLFINLEEPLAVFIINSKLLLAQAYGGHDNMPYRAYNLLRKLYRQKKTRESIPVELRKYLENDSIEPIENSYTKYLVGVEGHAKCYLCFNLDLNINLTQNPSIILSNLSLMNHSLNSRLSLTPTEVFFILSNICTNALCKNIDFFSLRNEKDIDEYYQTLHAKSQENLATKSEFPGYNFKVMLFGNNYLNYLEKLIINSQMFPHQILSHSGTRVLVSLLHLPSVFSFLKESTEMLLSRKKIPLTQMISYYTFIRMSYLYYNSITDFSIREKVRDLYLSNKEQLENIAISFLLEDNISYEGVVKKFLK